MSVNRIPVEYSDKSRQWADRMTRYGVSACGVSILLVMLVLFFWLLLEVLPLFFSPSMYSVSKGQLWQAQPLVAGGLDSHQRWSWRIDQQGQGQFLPTNASPPAPAMPLSPALSLAATDAQSGSAMLLDQHGALRLVEADFTGGEPRWRFPLGDRPVATTSTDTRQMTLQALPDARWLVALVQPQRVQVMRLTRDHPPVVSQISEAGIKQALLSPDGSLLYTLSHNHLSVWQATTQGYRLRDSHSLTRVPESMALLSGGKTLLLVDGQGISQWFDIAGDNGLRLQRIRDFVGAQGDGLLITEPQRRVFATLSREGTLSLFASKQEGAILRHQLSPAVTAAWFSPQGNGLWTETAQGWQFYRLDNPLPDISWRNFIEKTTYENYPNADYVWQSSAADDSYQGKYSLIPMISGTLKSALLAMLIATPLAVAAAMYTAWYMSPAVRRWVKPGIEMMGALPTVVIGLVSSIWLAPLLSDHLSGILLLPLMLVLLLLAVSWLARRVPPSLRHSLFRQGRETLVLLPLLLAVLCLTLWGIPWIEHLIWPQGLLARLSISYDQRNLLVAAVAMGFALVPLIFTLAEDALFSVPVSLARASLALGATPWQTMTGVILPGASAGVLAALMIGFGRAMGETMIVLMATSNTPQPQGGLFDGLRTLAANIAIEMPEAAAGSAHYRILFLSALVLLVFTLVVNTLAELLRQRLRQRFAQHEGQL